MTASGFDPGVEREVDLARWRAALRRFWWLAAAGLVAGAILGVLYSFGGGSTYKAAALISLGQPVSPGGVVVNGFGLNPRAIAQIVAAPAALEQAAQRADMSVSALRGHVSVTQVGVVTGSTATHSSPLISVTVQGPRAVSIAAAANELADIVVNKTTAPYVGVKIKTITTTLTSVKEQLVSINTRFEALTKALKTATHLDPLQQLVLVSEEDEAEARQGNLLQQQETLLQQLAFATQVESAEVVEPARADKSTARSRRTSLIIGAIIGLLLGGAAAIVVDGRRSRPAPAA